MPDTKIQKRFVYDGFGFPVVFLNVPMIKVRGAWTPNVNYNELARAMVLSLAHTSARLTGNQIRFIRHYFEMTLERFGQRFDVSHPAVRKWEAAGDEAPALKWPMEKDIRLFILDQLDVRPKEFKRAYESLRQEATARRAPIEMDVASAA
jgi:hypothetical protein